MTISLVLSCVLAFSVVAIAAIKKKAVPESISEIAYIIPHWAFSSWIVMVGILVMPDMMDSLNEDWQWVGFLSIAGLMLVASSAYYKTEAKALHYIGGCLCAVCASVVVALIQPWLLLSWIAYAIIMIKPPGSWLFWGEVVIYALLFVALSV